MTKPARSPHLRSLAVTLSLSALSLAACERASPTPSGASVTPDAGTEADVEARSEAITGGWTDYSRGLVRIDLTGSRRCSGFLAAPNMIVTAAHCIQGRTISGTHDGVWNGMKWAEIRLRIVYKPSQSEVMCINETCRDGDGDLQRTTVLVFWDNAYSYDVDTSSDVAIITRLAGGPFLTRAPDPGDPAPRSLDTGDYMRILSGSMVEGGYARMRGYGSHTDDARDVTPREGSIRIDDFSTYQIRGGVSHYFAAACEGDSGGPLVYDNSIYPHQALDHQYAAGVASRTSERTGDCPEHGDSIWWARLGPKRWMFDRIRVWSGNSACISATDTDAVGTHPYFRCW